MSRMFTLGKEDRIKTINPFHGCVYECYNGRCWANLRANRFRTMGVKGYEEGFKPTFCPWVLDKEKRKRKRFERDEVVAVGLMGDISCIPIVERKIIVRELIERNPFTTFLLESKNPMVYKEMISYLPSNVILSTTIETNRWYDYEGVSKAPSPLERYNVMKELNWDKKHISAEPIMDFDLYEFFGWLHSIEPMVVSIGYDNYNAGLKEPTLKKTIELIKMLEHFVKVEKKTIRNANWEIL